MGKADRVLFETFIKRSKYANNSSFDRCRAWGKVNRRNAHKNVRWSKKIIYDNSYKM